MLDLNALALDLHAARVAKVEADTAAKEAGAAVREAESLLFDALVEAGLERITAHGHTFSLDTKTYYSVAPENMDAFHEAMESEGRGSIFKYTVHHATLNATIRELVEQRGGMPESIGGLVKAYDEGKVNVRKASKG